MFTPNSWPYQLIFSLIFQLNWYRKESILLNFNYVMLRDFIPTKKNVYSRIITISNWLRKFLELKNLLATMNEFGTENLHTRTLKVNQKLPDLQKVYERCKSYERNATKFYLPTCKLVYFMAETLELPF